MDVLVTQNSPAATAVAAPAFPLIRFDTGMAVYQEALVNGRYSVVNGSAVGRPRSREWVWKELQGDSTSVRPLRTRQHAFHLEVDGQLLADRWAWAGAREVDATDTGHRESVVSLRHVQRPVAVDLHTRLDETPFLVRRLAITNLGERPAALSQVFPWSCQVWEAGASPWNNAPISTLGRSPFTLGRFTETTPGAEGSFGWMPLPNGTYGFETLHGRSGWGAPFFILRNEVTGEMLVTHFAWPGNWRIDFFNDYESERAPVNDARLYARVGLAGPSPLRILDPGETVLSPEVHFGFMYGDLDRCVQALHQHVRRSVAPVQPPGREHRVEVNHTGYTRNAQITETQLYEEIDLAADAGVELFMLDAGWFGAASERWSEAVGDWSEESPLLPSGVRAAFDRVRSTGMLCGLWVEAERMGAASALLRDHPDWQMERTGEKIPNLDLSRPEVAAHLERTIVALIERYELDCFRLDYNISVGEGGEAERAGYTENVMWRYYDALHAIFNRVRERFPNLLLENCSSGGGRTDLGMMSGFHWTQITDRWAPGPTLKVVNGLTIALPPELCETILGAISDGVSDLDFMLRIGLFGHFCVSGIFPTMEERQVAARERWRRTIDLYKTFVRPMLPTCRMFHHTPVQRQGEPGEWVVLECASPEGDRAYAGIFRLPGATDDAYQFRPRGLNPSLRYRVAYDSKDFSCEVDGLTLADRGLRILVPGAFTSELLLFEAVGGPAR